MEDVDAINLVLLVLRVVVGTTMIAHGYNHIFGGGKIEGTAGWFESLGMRPGILHAWLASLTELGAGALLVLGLATPLGAAGIVGTLAVAWITNHRDAGFFVFNRPTEGWEYMLVLVTTTIADGALGPGEWSVDGQVDTLAVLAGTSGLLITVLLGLGGAALTLAVFWRPGADGDDGDDGDDEGSGDSGAS